MTSSAGSSAQACRQSYENEAHRRGLDLHEYLTELAAAQPVGAHGLVALDWHNGNRSLLVDHELSGLVVGQTLSTKPEDVYRALLESTAFGTRAIIEAFNTAGVPVTELIIAGGLLKNRLLMQIYADVTRLPLSIVASEQGPALGSAIHAAVAAGAYPDVRSASAAMGKVRRRGVHPGRGRAARVRRACTPSTARCTTTSAAAATTSCTASARSVASRWENRHDRQDRATTAAPCSTASRPRLRPCTPSSRGTRSSHGPPATCQRAFRARS